MIRRNPTSYADILVSWETMLNAMAAEPEKTAHLQERIDRLKALRDRGHEVLGIQDRASSDRQKASKEMKALVREGEKLATFLRFGLKEIFGNTNEELVAYGIQPFRRRGRASNDNEPDGSEPKPEPTPAPSSTSPSEPAE